MLRAGHGGLAWSHVDLHGFGGVHVGRVGDGRGDVCGVGAGLGDVHAVDRKGRVAQAEAERVVDGLVVRVVVAVADEHALTIVDVPLLTRPVDHARIVVDVHRNGLCQLAGRADLTEDHVGKRRTAGLAEQPGFEDALGVARPWCHGDDGAVGQHHDDVLVFGGDGVEQFDLLGGNIEGFTVEAFGFGGFRKP